MIALALLVGWPVAAVIVALGLGRAIRIRDRRA